MANDTPEVPMSSEQMQAYLQEQYGVPIALRLQGTTTVKCPYCDSLHDHGPQPGYHVALCDDRGQGVFVRDRYFVPNYGYTIFEYKESDRGNELVDLVN
jgi:hypothetical protein